jgi:hypothetical protein
LSEINFGDEEQEFDNFLLDDENLKQKIFNNINEFNDEFDNDSEIFNLMTTATIPTEPLHRNEKFTTKKRGKKKESKTNILHSKENADNIRRKIKCHFHNFIVNYFNHLIKIKKKGNLKFKKIKYSYAANDLIKFNQDLLQKKISDFFKLDISEMYKNYQKNENELVYEKLIKRFDYDVLKLFDLTYIEFYQYYYLNDSLHFNNSKINNFYDLYKKEQQKESNKTKKKYSNLLKFIAEQRFINYYFPNRIFKIEQKYDSESNNKIQTLCCNKDNESKFNSQMMENESQKPYLEEEEEKNESPIFIFEEMQIEYNFSFKI